jgi:hypothetical protein
MDFGAMAGAACRALEAIIGAIPTILMIALTFGLIALAAGLTVYVGSRVSAGWQGDHKLKGKL